MPTATSTRRLPPIGEFSQVVLKTILDNQLLDETAASRVKQIGMLVIIAYMQQLGIEPTGENIAEHTGIARTSLYVVMAPLIARGLIKEAVRRNRAGSGRVTTYSFDEAMYDACERHLLSVSVRKSDLPRTRRTG